jgi:RHS repeat-associated protein
MAMPHPNGNNNEISSPAFCLSSSCIGNRGAETPQAGDHFTVVTEIELPDGTKYGYSYDQIYGTISKITFPTGGYVRFVWTVRDEDWNPYGQYNEISSVVVTDAYVSPSGSGDDEQHWGYTPGNSGVPASLSTSSTPIGYVYAPDGTYTYYTGKCNFYYGMVPYFSIGPRGSCKEASHANYSSSGVLLASQAEQYTPQGLTAQVNSTVYGASSPMQKETVYSYDGYNNVIEKDESDFYPCSGSPCPVTAVPSTKWLRHTYTQYAYTGSSASDVAMNAAHIVNKPSQVTVTDGTSSQNPYSLATYAYDSNGNLLTEKKCLTISGTGSAATCGSSYWQTSYTYDSTGQLLTKTEGANSSASAETSYTWTGQNNGFLTTVTHPNGFTDTYTYFTPTGEVKTHTNWNGQTTTYAYSDPLNRITSVKLPATTDATCGSSAQGTTTYTYTDDSGAFAVQEQHSVDSCATTTSVTKNYDGLGRLANTQTTVPTAQCSTGIIKVVTGFDSMSRVASVTNPYCSTSDPTYGTTQYAYDGLGRKIQTTLPDGSISTIAYAGAATEATDPFNGTTSVQHIQQTDGLGRLINVCEVSSASYGGTSPTACGLSIAGTGFLTTYTYDPLGNMLGVNQHGLTRSFTYDYLSRLTQAVNPEVGPDKYTYSNSTTACAPDESLPCIRTDARGVNTNYKYDNMSRLISKSYAVQGTNTTGSITDLTDCYQYDVSVPGVADSNPKGELTAEWQQAGTCPAPPVASIPSGAVNSRVKGNHDAMGRVGVDWQCLGACPTSVPAAPVPGYFVYSYNLLGNPVQSSNGIYEASVPWNESNHTNNSPFTNPSVTWKTTYDQADHIVQTVVQDQPGTSVFPAATFSTAPTLLSVGSHYDPFGHMTAVGLGIPYGSTTAPINITRAYDNRARITSELDKGADMGSEETQSLGTVEIGGTEQVSGSTYDSGTISVTINGKTAQVSYGQGSTAATITSALSTQLQSADSSFLTAIKNGDVEVLTSIGYAAGDDWTITATVTYNSAVFSSPSFTATAKSMVGGASAGTSNGTLYAYNVPDGGYAPNGNILAHSDSVMGDWYFSYDSLDRLSTAGVTSTMTSTTDPELPNWYTGMFGCWTYDSFGNRLSESISATACTSNPPKQSWATYNSANNQMTSMSIGTTVTPVYDASGNVLYDGNNEYWYDAEGRICASSVIGGGGVYQYAYDAEGARYAVGTLTNAPATYTPSGSTYKSPTCAVPSGSNFSLSNQYLVDLAGNQVTEINNSTGATGMAWAHSNVWIGGENLATYDYYGPALHFNLEDPLGTKRVVANILGEPDEMCTSLPFGNDTGNPWQVNCQMETNSLNTYSDPSEHHYTGKERDTESGNDYFGARYYSSAMGRFMSPDWSAQVEPVPYAKLDDPQSLNLYAYVRNNPLSRFDRDGHYVCADGKKCDSANDKAFQSRLDNLKKAQGTFKEGSKEYNAIGKILSNYGGAGETGTANGKTVSVGFSGQPDSGGLTKSVDKTNISVNFASNFSQQSEGNNVGTTVLVGHEGQHVVDGAPSGTARFRSEFNAESTSQMVMNGLDRASIIPTYVDRIPEEGPAMWQRGGDPGLGGAPYNPGSAFLYAVEDYKQDVQNDHQ